MGLERAVAIGRIAERVPDLMVSSEVPDGRDVERAEAHAVHQGAEAGETQ